MIEHYQLAIIYQRMFDKQSFLNPFKSLEKPDQVKAFTDQ